MNDTKKTNMDIYNRYRAVPDNATKPISAGRLKGMTDINPMWRIQSLTEMFGPCGIGWYATIDRAWIDEGANGEMVANVEALLYIKVNGEWSEPIAGFGGSMFVSNERNGLHTSDEAFKMAYTDAISVCCKLLGFGADVYWAAGRTKYTASTEPDPLDKLITCDICGAVIKPFKDSAGKITPPEEWKEKSIKSLGKCVCNKCIREGRHIGNEEE